MSIRTESHARGDNPRRCDAGEVSLMLGANIQMLAPALLGENPTSKSRTAWRFRNRGSLAVEISGQDRGLWFDHEAGRGGDALDLVAYTHGRGLKDALEWSRNWLGQRPVETPAVQTIQRLPKAADHGSAEFAVAIWMEAIAPSGTAAEAYLHNRRLELPAAAPLRFHPACPRGNQRLPAMISLMTDPSSNEPVGVCRTFIKPDGSGKAEVTPAKMMLGNAGVIRLVADEDVTMGLGIAEGIETALAVMQRAGWSPVWAATSAGGIATFPVLAGIECLTIFADHDAPNARGKQPGLDAARMCASRWQVAGREVVIQKPPQGMDWDDALKVAA